MDRWRWCRDGRAKSSQRRCPPMLHAPRSAVRSRGGACPPLGTGVARCSPAAVHHARHAHPRPHPPARARALGMARRAARGGARLRPAVDAVRCRPPRHRHRRARWHSGARPAGRRSALRRPGRRAARGVDRSRGRSHLELRTGRAAGLRRRCGRARRADRRAAAGACSGRGSAAPGCAPGRRLRRSARPAGRRAARAAAERQARQGAGAPQARGCAVR